MVNTIVDKAWALYFMVVMFTLFAVYWIKRKLQEKEKNEK